MKIAVPLAGETLSAHFGHCERFAIFGTDPSGGKPGAREDLIPPPHEPGLYPAWLAERGTTHVLAGGMGEKARKLFADKGIEVIVGAPSLPADQVVALYLEGSLKTSDNRCEH